MTKKLDTRVYKWTSETKDRCSKCGESDCETAFIYPSSKRKILVRDCDPHTANRLPRYLLEVITGDK